MSALHIASRHGSGTSPELHPALGLDWDAVHMMIVLLRFTESFEESVRGPLTISKISHDPRGFIVVGSKLCS